MQWLVRANILPCARAVHESIRFSSSSVPLSVCVAVRTRSGLPICLNTTSYTLLLERTELSPLYSTTRHAALQPARPAYLFQTPAL